MRVRQPVCRDGLGREGLVDVLFVGGSRARAVLFPCKLCKGTGSTAFVGSCPALRTATPGMHEQCTDVLPDANLQAAPNHPCPASTSCLRQRRLMPRAAPHCKEGLLFAIFPTLQHTHTRRCPVSDSPKIPAQPVATGCLPTEPRQRLHRARVALLASVWRQVNGINQHSRSHGQTAASQRRRQVPHLSTTRLCRRASAAAVAVPVGGSGSGVAAAAALCTSIAAARATVAAGIGTAAGSVAANATDGGGAIGYICSSATRACAGASNGIVGSVGAGGGMGGGTSAGVGVGMVDSRTSELIAVAIQTCGGESERCELGAAAVPRDCKCGHIDGAIQRAARRLRLMWKDGGVLKLCKVWSCADPVQQSTCQSGGSGLLSEGGVELCSSGLLGEGDMNSMEIIQ
eukprot:365469-Chlamydomonas_euryale.AAC.22